MPAARLRPTPCTEPFWLGKLHLRRLRAKTGPTLPRSACVIPMSDCEPDCTHGQSFDVGSASSYRLSLGLLCSHECVRRFWRDLASSHRRNASAPWGTWTISPAPVQKVIGNALRWRRPRRGDAVVPSICPGTTFRSRRSRLLENHPAVVAGDVAGTPALGFGLRPPAQGDRRGEGKPFELFTRIPDDSAPDRRASPANSGLCCRCNGCSSSHDSGRKRTAIVRGNGLLMPVTGGATMSMSPPALADGRGISDAYCPSVGARRRCPMRTSRCAYTRRAWTQRHHAGSVARAGLGSNEPVNASRPRSPPAFPGVWALPVTRRACLFTHFASILAGLPGASRAQPPQRTLAATPAQFRSGQPMSASRQTLAEMVPLPTDHRTPS